MSGEGFVVPICETLQLLLGEAKNNDEETRVVLVLQTRSFFEEIIPATHVDSSFLPDVVSNVHTLFRIVNDALASFLKDEATAVSLGALVSLISGCEICAQFGQDLSLFVLGFIFSDLASCPGHRGLFACIGDFFQNPSYPPFFEALGGLLALWDLLLKPEKSELGNLVFDKVSRTIPLYFQAGESPDYLNFLSHVSKTMPNMPEGNAPNAFQFLFDLLSNAKGDMLSAFINIGGFEAINRYIVTKDDPQLLIVYQMFRVMCVSRGGEANPILGQLIDLIQSPDASDSIKNNGMVSLFNTIRQFDRTEPPLQAHQLYTLAVSLSGEAGVVFIDMCHFLATHFQLDISAILPAMSKLFDAKTALEQNMSSLFEIFHMIGESLRPFAAMFYAQIPREWTHQQFAEMANKYPDFLTFLPMAFEEGNANKPELFLFFLKSYNQMKDHEQFARVFTSIMAAPNLVQIVTDVLLDLTNEPELATLTMKMVTQAAISSGKLRKSLTEMGIVTVIRQMTESHALDNVTILNACAALSGGHFDLVCDTAVCSFLKGVDYLDQPEDVLTKLAFGLQQEETELRVGHLCYPSLLHKCGDFTIVSDYDLWVCGQYAIDNWMRETGKTIAEFPSIVNVARRFLLPKHVPLMFEHPHLFAEACNDTFGLIPLFEFVKDCLKSEITIPVAFPDKTVSFWVRFKEYPPTSQQICSMDGQLFKVQNDEFQINEIALLEYQVERWYHIVLTSTDKGKFQVYINQTLKHSGTSVRDHNVVFGSEESNGVNWFIGGAIRIYDSVLDKSKIEGLAAISLTDTISHEPITIQPSTFIQLFEGPIDGSIASAGENARPVLSFPLSNHIRTAYGGNEGIFAQILELLADDRTSDCRDFLNALCNLQAQRLSKWSSKEFSAHISMLIHMSPTLVDVKTFDNIIESFTCHDSVNETFDWFSFLTILLDFGLLNSPLRAYMISKLFGFVAQFPPSESKSLFGVFVFEAFHIIEFDKDERISFGELIKRFDLNPAVICRMIASLPDFAANITVPSLKYEPSDESPLFDHLLEILTKFIDCDFTQTFLFHVLPPNCSIDFMYQMILSALTANKVAALDQYFIMKFCITYCYIPKAWSCVLTLLTGVASDAEMEMEFQCQALNPVVLPSFVLMVSLLAISSMEMSETSYWRKLTNAMLNLLLDNLEKVPPVVLSDPDFIFALMQLISFGLMNPSITIYPFAPSLPDAKEVAELSVQRGQKFPDGEPQPCPFPTFQSYSAGADLADTVHTVLLSSLPKVIKILPGKSIDTPYDDYNVEFCAKAVSMNRMEKWNDWQDFMQSIRSMFGLSEHEHDLDKVLSSEIFTKVLKFVVGIIVKSSNAPIMSDLLSKVLLSTTVTLPRYSMVLMERMAPLLLEELSHRLTFSVSVLQFLCERLREGWFGTSVLSMINLMVLLCEVCEKTTPDLLADVLIDAFDLLDEKDLTAYLNFFIGHSQCIFAKNNIDRPEFCVLMMDRLLSLCEAHSEIVSAIIGRLCEAMTCNEELHSRWTKNVLPSCPDCDLKLLIEGLSVLVDKGFEEWSAWREKNVILEMDWSKLRTRENMKHSTQRSDAVLESLSKISDHRIHMSSTFFTNAHGLLGNIHNDMTVSKAVCACLRNFQRERLLIAVSFFMRQREMILTKEYRFDVVQSNIKALTLLSDPLIPSKRVERSPLVYVVPPFPGSDCVDVQPELPEVHELLPLLPEKIQSLLVTPYYQFEDFVFHTKKQLKLSFSQIIPISDSMNLGILELIMNDGKKFEAMWNISLLYGVDPLPGIALRTSNSIIFVEGMELTKTGIRYRYSETPRILYTFYMSYFIAGHFGPCSLMGAHPVVRWPTDEVIFQCRHYWLHRPTAIEVTFISGWSFILIPEFAQCEQFFAMWRRFVDETLARFPKPSANLLAPLNSAHLLKRKDYTKLWQEGSIDNFTYICILNRFGCRSLADYTQYYVFPWVVGDYNSSSLENAPIESFRDLHLPMGQIGRERAPRFDMVFEDSDSSYFYGTHYMHLGVVLYFMFRIDPFCLFSIYLHHGWDHQNRLFYDVYETWMAAAYTAPADVKELIPEFFSVPEFLVNLGELPLTTTTEGKPVANVNLGHWCKNPYDFIHKMQHFLQCELVTENLSNWIDLIFGFKSRGQSAVEAKNVFHPLCYVRPMQDEAIESEDEIEREAAITCIINFGQCCMQLFNNPHPQPTRMYNRQHIMSDPDKVIWQRLNCQSVRFPVSDIKIRDNEFATACGMAMLLPPFFTSEISLDSARLCVSVSSPKPHAIFTDNFLDSTKAFCVSKDGVFMGIGQIEGSASLYLLKYSNSNELVEAQFVDRFATNGAVSLIAISSAHFLMLTASGNHINRIDIGTRRVIEPIEAKSRVNCLTFDNYGGLIIAGGYSSISIWNVSGTLIADTTVDSSVMCIDVAELPEVVPNRFFVTGHSNGFVRFWTVNYTELSIVCLKEVRLASSAIRRLSVNDTAMKVIVATSEEVFCLDYVGSPAKNLKKLYAVECCHCRSKIEKTTLTRNVKTCASCHRFLCKDCISKDSSMSQVAKRLRLCPYCASLMSEPASSQ